MRARRADASRRRWRRRPTLLQVLAVLQAIFAHAVTTDRVTDNPVSRVAKPRLPGGREVPPVPPATVEAAACTPRARRRADGLRARLRRAAPPRAARAAMERH